MYVSHSALATRFLTLNFILDLSLAVLPPRRTRQANLDLNLRKKIAAHLVTNHNIPKVESALLFVNHSVITEWGKLLLEDQSIVVHSEHLVRRSEKIGSRNATFVRVSSKCIHVLTACQS